MGKRAKTGAAIGLIAGTALLAYSNSLKGPFVFDDGPATTENGSIRNLWPPWSVLAPPAGTTVSGRPIANLTFAFNHAMSGSDTWSYHALNVLILILGGITLFGILRRTFLLPVMRARFGQDSGFLALAIALLWTLHPLQTEAVTYVVQRVESLMGLFYLLTFYCLIRSAESERPFGWQVCTVAACALGMATKEVMVTAPLLAFLFDRTFVAGTFRKAWGERRGLYLGLTATWLPLVFLVAGTGWNRQASAGFTDALAPQSYWLTQVEAVGRYLQLSVWPSPLVFDYGAFLVGGPSEVVSYALFVVPLGVLGLIALWRWPPMGFLGAWFFAILAPTSLVPVATQTMAEHRMYLPLIAVVALFGASAYAFAGRRCWVPLTALGLVLGVATYRRNQDYRSALALWSDTVSKRPDNARAHCSLGHVLASIPGRRLQAISEFETSLRIHPEYADAHTDLGIVLEDEPGRLDEAIHHLREAARLKPDLSQTHFNLAAVMARADSMPTAIAEYEAALRIDPKSFAACANLGALLCSEGNVAEGTRLLETALRIKPDYARAHFFLGNVLVRTGQVSAAIQQFEDALHQEPDFAEASNNLGVILFRTGRTREGMGFIDAAIRMQPDYIPAHFSRGAALMQDGRRDEAAVEFEKILQLRPGEPSAARMLELIRSTP